MVHEELTISLSCAATAFPGSAAIDAAARAATFGAMSNLY